MRRAAILSVVLTFAALMSGGNPARAAPAGGKPPGPHAIVKITPRSIGSGGTVPVAGGRAGLPAHGGPPVALKADAYQALRTAMRQPRPAPAGPHPSPPAKGTFARLIGSASTEHGHSYWNGRRWVVPPGTASRSLPLLLIPRRPTGQAGIRPSIPAALDPSTQVDSATPNCSSPRPNEPSVAQSSDNPNIVVVAAQAFMDSQGNCGDGHPWVFYSHDGGQHWQQQIVPGLTPGLAGGDPGIVYDPKHHDFVYSFLQLSQPDQGTDSIDVTRSLDGASWSPRLILASHTEPGLDKPMIAVDRSPSSPHFGRVLVGWLDQAAGSSALIDAFTDDGGGSWTGSSDTINTMPDCANGVSPAFDANGEVMAAWFDCNNGNTIQEALSTDGGADWNRPSNKVITGVTDIGSNGPGGTCALNFGGSNFRCDSFPSLAGDPSPTDAGGRAFFVVFATWDTATQGGVTANVSQVRGYSTVDGGGSWNGGNFLFDYMAPRDFGDKFFPWASFAPNGRLNVGYSNREASASAANPNGLSFNEGQSEASSLTALRNGSFIAYTADSTLGNPGSLAFIGDYGGIESQDNNFDTFPVWTDVRNTTDVRTTDLCYVDCPTFLQPETPLFRSKTQGSAFDDLYQFNTDPGFGGAGAGFWNAVGIREGGDGSVIDDDMGLFASRYFRSQVADGSLGPPNNDYVLENDSSGRGPSQPYFVNVDSSGSSGGSYAVEWAHGRVVLNQAMSDSMRNGDVIRVYNMSDTTGTTYHLGLRPAAGNTSNYRLSVHLNGGGTYQGSNAASATSGNAAIGSPAFITASTGFSPTGFDALVVQNNNGGSGGYTLFRDTAAPAGTISINSGATATNSTSVTLNLTAANPTAGDPVSDMRLSSDGVTYGPWMPFTASAPFSLAPGDGPKTVFAEFRNGAGAISPSASHSIILNTAARSLPSGRPGRRQRSFVLASVTNQPEGRAFLRVIEPGEIRAADPVEIVHRSGHDVTVALVLRAMTREPELLARLLVADALPEEGKELARRRTIA